MTRKHLHDRTSLTTLHEWGDPVNPRDSLNMALYWHARRWKFTAQRTYQPPLYDRSPRRLHAHIAVNDTRRVTNGPYRRWEQTTWKRFEEELAAITKAREDEAALRLYDIATGRAPLPDDTNSP